MLRIVAAIIGMIMLAGCGVIEKRYVKAFSGKDVPDSKKVLLKPAEGVIIHSIDGNQKEKIVSTQSLGLVEYDIGLLPGAHSLVVSYYDGNLSSRLKSDLQFQSEAGHRYLLQFEITDYGGWMGGRGLFKFTDVTGRKECWTVIKHKRPSECK